MFIVVERFGLISIEFILKKFESKPDNELPEIRKDNRYR